MDKIYGRDIEELSTHNVAKSIKIPVLVIHDKQDEEVPVKCAYSICNNLVNHELLITEGLGHRKILWDRKVIEKINHFFTFN
jgi:pimeloyl-ACP methyl ester carboxylesterase